MASSDQPSSISLSSRLAGDSVAEASAPGSRLAHIPHGVQRGLDLSEDLERRPEHDHDAGPGDYSAAGAFREISVFRKAVPAD